MMRSRTIRNRSLSLVAIAILVVATGAPLSAQSAAPPAPSPAAPPTTPPPAPPTLPGNPLSGGRVASAVKERATPATVTGGDKDKPSKIPEGFAKPVAEGDGVKLWKETWEGTKTLKYLYEMRRGSENKLKRNGYSMAFYANGGLEREGFYRNNERIGVWKYYAADGKFLREEDRGDGKPEQPATPPAPTSPPKP